VKIGFMVNDIATEEAGYSTTRLAVAAINRGHEAWVLSAGDFAYDPDEKIRGRAVQAPKAKYTSGAVYLSDLRSSRARAERITIDDLDVLMLRSNPAEDTSRRPWAQSAGIDFGRIAMRNGVIRAQRPPTVSARRSTRCTSSCSPRRSAHARSSRATDPRSRRS